MGLVFEWGIFAVDILCGNTFVSLTKTSQMPPFIYLLLF